MTRLGSPFIQMYGLKELLSSAHFQQMFYPGQLE